MTDRVAILGCGYVGLELGRRLTPEYEVVGVRRSAQGIAAIESAGFGAVRADATDPESLAAVPDPDVVVFAASSGGRGPEAARDTYIEGQRTAIDHFGSRDDPPDRYVYTSSTGVYGDHGGEWVDETTPLDPDSERGEILVDAEQTALERPAEYGIDGTVARLAGLYGPERYRLERYIEGPVTEGILNMVHRDDAAGAIAFLLSADEARGEVVLVVDDEPVERTTFADWLADSCDLDAPEKQTKAERLANVDSESARRRIRASKRCSNDKLRALGYEFQYPTFREGYARAITSYQSNN